MTEHYLSTDEAEDVAGSVRHAVLCLSNVATDQQAWKWLLLALHSALSGACICHLVTTASPLGAVTKKNAAEWINYFEQSRSDESILPPPTRMMALPCLLKAIRKPYSAGDQSNPSGIYLSESELRWFIRLHSEIRNQFVHFQPMSWSIEVSGIPKFAMAVARIIREIMDYGWAFRHKDSAWKEDLNRRLAQLNI